MVWICQNCKIQEISGALTPPQPTSLLYKGIPVSQSALVCLHSSGNLRLARPLVQAESCTGNKANQGRDGQSRPGCQSSPEQAEQTWLAGQGKPEQAWLPEQGKPEQVWLPEQGRPEQAEQAWLLAKEIHYHDAPIKAWAQGVSSQGRSHSRGHKPSMWNVSGFILLHAKQQRALSVPHPATSPSSCPS